MSLPIVHHPDYQAPLRPGHRFPMSKYGYLREALAARGLMRLVRSLAEEDGRTVLIVLHDINYATAFADHVVVLKDGRIADAGRPVDVVSETLLRDVFGTDAKVLDNGGRPVVLV